MESLQGAGLGWLLAGLFLGWLGNWLFDMIYRRDGHAAGELTSLQVQALNAEFDRLQKLLAERDAHIDALRDEVRGLGERMAGAAAKAPASRPQPRAAKGRRQEASGKA